MWLLKLIKFSLLYAYPNSKVGYYRQTNLQKLVLSFEKCTLLLFHRYFIVFKLHIFYNIIWLFINAFALARFYFKN